MSNESIHQTVWDLAWLLSCAVHRKTPPRKEMNSMDLEKLYKMAKFHSLAAMAAMALEASGIFMETDGAESKRWKETKEKAIRKTILLDGERSAVLQFMEQNGIWYLPLKGCIIKNYYPRIGMREMADNDILYDGSCQNILSMSPFMQDTSG